ncbi:MAG: NAD-dependent epimerase/dehydratase family protein, partial [Geminicoccaceae bacterium]
LYLGDAGEVIKASTPPDPKSEERGEYARAKALCDEDLIGLHRKSDLPVVILRPGLVVGEGTSPFHSGLGFYNNDQHCMGWGDGRNPLPLVLVDDVADAIVAALEADAVLGGTYNIIGDVRPDAEHYVADLAEALGRPLRFHGQTVNRLYAVEWAKWVLKRLGGRKMPLPSKRDLRSRGLYARFDLTAEKQELGWTPNDDAARFKALAIDSFRAKATSDVIPFAAQPGDGGERVQGVAGGG